MRLSQPTNPTVTLSSAHRSSTWHLLPRSEMVKSTGAQYVILGHSERREYYKETPEILKEKVLLALKNGLKVIFCIGESLAEREANKQNEVVKAELEGSVFNLSEEDFRKIIIAYEPIWARLLLRTPASCMVALARPLTLLSCSPRLTSTVVSSAVLR